MKRGFFLIILVVIMTDLMIDFGDSLVGVSPPQYKVSFFPNQNLVFKFSFMGDNGVPMKIYLEGDLAQYAELSTTRLEGPGDVNVLLKLPGSLSAPGNHNLYVGAEQESIAATGAGIKGGMKASVVVFVPYPGKYIVLGFNAGDAKKGENIDYSLKVFSYGSEDVKVSPYVELFNVNNQSAGKYILFSDVIKGNSQKSDSGKIATSALLSGSYTARAVVEYEGKAAQAEDRFKIGELIVEIKNYTDEIDRNMINKIDVDIESFWNDPLDNVYVQGEILDYNITFKTSSTSLNGFQRLTLLGYLDTSSIPEEVDKLSANFTVHYGSKASELMGILRFKETGSYNVFYIIGGLILVIIAVASIWIYRRKAGK